MVNGNSDLAVMLILLFTGIALEGFITYTIESAYIECANKIFRHNKIGRNLMVVILNIIRLLIIVFFLIKEKNIVVAFIYDFPITCVGGLLLENLGQSFDESYVETDMIKNPIYKQMRKCCKQCGYILPDDSENCPHCGLKSHIYNKNLKDDENQIFCTRCGYGLDENQDVCPQCGKISLVNKGDNDEK